MAASTNRGGRYRSYIGMWTYVMTVFVLLAALLIAWLQHEEQALVGSTIVVKPKHVVDGSSFYATTVETKVVRLRLRLVDSPPLDHPHGRRARFYLHELLFSRPAPHDVVCRVTGVDEAGGLIADVYITTALNATGSASVQEEMVRRGWALAMEGGFAPNDKLRRIMAEAREAKRGVWKDEGSLEGRHVNRASSLRAVKSRQRHSSRKVPHRRWRVRE